MIVNSSSQFSKLVKRNVSVCQVSELEARPPEAVPRLEHRGSRKQPKEYACILEVAEASCNPLIQLSSRIPETLSFLPNVAARQLDVTSDGSVADALRAVSALHRCADAADGANADPGAGPGLDILVNSAGIVYTTPLLHAAIDKARDIYKTNVWGMLRMVQGFLGPLVARKGRGINGLYQGPWILELAGLGTALTLLNPIKSGDYTSSKSALTLLTETLRLELFPLNVSTLSLMLGIIGPLSVPASLPSHSPDSRYTAIRDTIEP
ncbi:uncharacterized protein DSM5745_10236 [Aspergillus mulundensis]|uniref:NAD(P)-binding protein n=1 Tax=Aspergillus mulundensis TaxID=1810919 RepID=A0A3D8QMW2_9EURO|nr:hypothetical protein DSM5745_10236 [Aspergillus mulundensis]RDW63125.1 hypothetical protein DSM5745_10236 [Aspergillus mulundensis]